MNFLVMFLFAEMHLSLILSLTPVAFRWDRPAAEPSPGGHRRRSRTPQVREAGPAPLRARAGAVLRDPQEEHPEIQQLHFPHRVRARPLSSHSTSRVVHHHQQHQRLSVRVGNEGECWDTGWTAILNTKWHKKLVSYLYFFQFTFFLFFYPVHFDSNYLSCSCKNQKRTETI